MSLLVLQLALCLALLSSSITPANTQNTDAATRTWLNNLRINSIRTNNIKPYELNRLKQVRGDMMSVEYVHAGFMGKAEEFAKFMNPTSVAKLCSYLNYFAYKFNSLRNTEARNNPNLSNKKAGQNVLQIITNDMVKQDFDQSLKTVDNYHMAYKSNELLPMVNINSDRNKIIEDVKKHAKNNKIRFGSKEAAAYHMKKHPMGDENRYVILANMLISNPNANAQYTSTGTYSADIKFSIDKRVCVVLITNGNIILKTFY